MTPHSGATDRRGLRGSWPIRLRRLEESQRDDLTATSSAVERLTMVQALTLEAWELTGWELPSYPRRETPMRWRPPTGEPAPR